MKRCVCGKNGHQVKFKKRSCLSLNLRPKKHEMLVTGGRKVGSELSELGQHIDTIIQQTALSGVSSNERLNIDLGPDPAVLSPPKSSPTMESNMVD